MKKIITVVLLATLLSTVAFGGLFFKKKETKKEPTIGLIVSTLNNPFFVDLKNGAEEEAIDKGIKIIILDSQNDPAKELANMENLITQKVDVILINPTDSSAVVNAVRMANNKKYQ